MELSPAGKKITRLSLLSGGEKALGAISFLFALFLARPCPFYLLDEVEAALDDTNIGRFCALLRQFSDRAQFIVVTHQKRTMEAADALYGVTMGGDGVFPGDLAAVCRGRTPSPFLLPSCPASTALARSRPCRRVAVAGGDRLPALDQERASALVATEVGLDVPGAAAEGRVRVAVAVPPGDEEVIRCAGVVGRAGGDDEAVVDLDGR